MPERMFTDRHGLYTLQGDFALFAPVDGVTYFFGSLFARAPNTAAGARLLLVPKAGVITRFDIWISSITGTSETVNHFIRLNDTTDHFNIQSSYDVNPRVLNSSADSVAVTAGDNLEVKIVMPTWVTNPTNVIGSAVISIRI